MIHVRACAASCGAVFLSFLGNAAIAASPAQGTLSPASPTLTFTTGPSLISNQSGNAALTCTDPAFPCDDYALTVDLPADFASAHPGSTIVIATVWAEVADDYDIYLLNAAGAEANSSAGGANPEVMTQPAASGAQQYTVRIVPFLVTNSTATTTITLVAGTAGGGGGTPPPAAGGLAPRYQVHNSPPDLGNEAGEPTLGFNPFTQRVMFISYTQALRISFPENADPALPAACDAIWEDKSGTITTLNSLDPILYTDQTTGRTFNSQLSGANSLFEFSDDDGDTWTPGQIGPPNGGADHQGIVTGPYPAGQRPLTATYPNALYYCSQSTALAFCSRSDDGGQTFGAGTPFKDSDCSAGALHGHPKVAPDGTLYVPDSSQCVLAVGGTAEKVVAFVSEDAGLTYSARPVPDSIGGAPSDPSVGVATDGTLYMCYEDGSGPAYMAVSHDKGLTWEPSVNIGAALGLVHAQFPATIAGDSDRAACFFLGSTVEGNISALDYEGVWYPYVATTYDGGLSYHLVNASPNDPVQGMGGIGGPGDPNRNLLDFNDLEIDDLGRTLPAFADGCIGGCVQDPRANPLAAKAAIIRQTGGRSLFAAHDDEAGSRFNGVAPLKPAPACASQARSLRTVASTRVEWNAPDDGGSPIVNYQVQRATAPDSSFTAIGDAGTKTRYFDRSADTGVPTYYYRVVAQNALGAATASNTIALPVTTETLVNTCALPGDVIVPDSVGDGTAPDTDIVYLAVAEPEDYDGFLVVTLKLAGFSAGEPPPSSFYGVLFPLYGSFYFALDVSQVVPRFVYGTFATLPQGVLQFTEAGTLDARSSYGADGAVVMIVPKDLFPNSNPGDVIAGFDVRARIGSSSATSRDSAGGGTYTVRGTAICAPNTAPVASLLASPIAGAAPLKVSFVINASDEDGDSVAQYSLSFGDGESVDDQSVSSLPVAVEHTYASGTYAARLTVTDARGLLSSNVAGQNIDSGTSSTAPASVDDHERFGGSSLGFLLLLPLLGLGALCQRNRV